MKNITVLSLLKSLNKDEINEFKDFIHSPFFNKNKNLISLYGILKNYVSNDSLNLTKEEIFTKLYPGKKYNYGIMNNLLYELNKLGEKYLEYKRMSKFKIDRQIYAMSEMFSRGLTIALERNIRETEKLMEKESKNDGYFYDRLNFDTLKNNYFIRYNAKKENLDFAKSSNEWLISYFLIKFFRINYNNLIQKYNFEIFENVDFIESLIKYVNTNKFEFEPVIRIYYNMFMTIYKSSDESYYKEQSDLIKQSADMLSRTELFNIYITQCNYCQKKIREGIIRYRQILFENYKKMLEAELYNYEGNTFIPQRLFRNIVQAALDVKNFDWVKKFISDYSERLEPAGRENEIILSNSKTFFAKEDYRNSMAELAKVKFDSVIDKPVFYIMQCKANFEIGDIDSIENSIDSFRHFIRYDKLLSAEIKKSLESFISAIVLLTRMKWKDTKNKTQKLDKLRKNLSAEETIEKEWLLEKINNFNK